MSAEHRKFEKVIRLGDTQKHYCKIIPNRLKYLSKAWSTGRTGRTHVQGVGEGIGDTAIGGKELFQHRCVRTVQSLHSHVVRNILAKPMARNRRWLKIDLSCSIGNLRGAEYYGNEPTANDAE